MTSVTMDIDLDQLASMDAEGLLRFAYDTYGERAAIGTSLQKTGVVLIDIAHRAGLPVRVFFVDTLLNNPETYDLLAEVQDRYSLTVERFTPADEDIESLKRSVGQYPHFLARPVCCRARKWQPLQKALATLDVWIAGLRSDQSERRSTEAQKASWVQDERGRRILKLNPMLGWPGEDVESYTREHDLPYNKLYDYESPYGERYTVIGCACCHIPVRPELGQRAGKFPWERSAKECGLHEQGGGI